MLDPATRLRVNDSQAAAEVMDGEAIIINLATGTYYSIDKTGAVIWELLAEGHDLGAIADATEKVCSIPREQVLSDLQSFVSELIEERLLVIREPDRPMASAAVVLDAVGEYERPVLMKYEDMGALLALDPPMPDMKPVEWTK